MISFGRIPGIKYMVSPEVCLLPRKSPSPYAFAPATQFLPSPSFCWFYKGGRNHTKIPLSSEEEKHFYTYIVMNTTRNKTRTKYPKEVS